VRDDGADWMGFITGGQLDSATDRINELLLEIRPDCVPLVDAFGHSDYFLSSAIGRYDGNVYEAIYDDAKTSPLNSYQYEKGRGTKMTGWDKLAPIFDLDFLQKGIGQRCSATDAELESWGVNFSKSRL
jgi:hypothetical protein